MEFIAPAPRYNSTNLNISNSNHESDHNLNKKQRLNDDEHEPSSLLSKDPQFMAFIDSVEDTQTTTDSQSLKRIHSKLLKSIVKNQLLRIKYPNDPLKFIDSEIDIAEDLKQLMSISSTPDLYTEFQKQGCVSTIVPITQSHSHPILILFSLLFYHFPAISLSILILNTLSFESYYHSNSNSIHFTLFFFHSYMYLSIILLIATDVFTMTQDNIAWP